MLYWGDDLLVACEKVHTYFSQEVAEWMTHYDPEASAVEHLGIYLTRNVLLFLHNCRERKCYNKHLAFALRCIKHFHLSDISLQIPQGF
jgi:hypothetical protein